MDIGRAYHSYDGFVVCTGTDTMAYAASALSFMLENLGKTVRRADYNRIIGSTRVDDKPCKMK